MPSTNGRKLIRSRRRVFRFVVGGIVFDQPRDKRSGARMTHTLLGIGKRHWRTFLPIWLFPIALLFTLALPGFESRSREYFFFLVFPAMIICGYVALKPWRSRGITFAQMFFWFAVVPFLIWGFMILGSFGLASLAGSLHSGATR